MIKTLELMKEIIEEYGYRIVENDGESLSVSFQLNTMILHPDTQDESFVAVFLSCFPEVTNENRDKLLAKCNKLNKNLKQVKFYIVKNMVVSSVEFHYCKKSDLRFQLKKAMENLVIGKVQFFD